MKGAVSSSTPSSMAASSNSGRSASVVTTQGTLMAYLAK